MALYFGSTKEANPPALRREWHVGEPFPIGFPEVVGLFQADGDELAMIAMTMRGHSIDTLMVYRAMKAGIDALLNGGASAEERVRAAAKLEEALKVLP